MTKEIKLKAELRTEKNGKVKSVRESGFLPAVLYGAKTESKIIKIKQLDFEKAYQEAGESNLIDLSINDKEDVRVLIKDVQREPLKDFIIHVDFYQVDMNKKINAEIPFNFIGESKAIKELGGILVKNMDTVEVECLPSDLPDHIDIDISILENFGDAIKLHSLNLPNGVKIIAETNDSIVGVSEPRIQEEEKEETSAEVEETDKDGSKDTEQSLGEKEDSKDDSKKEEGVKK